MSKKPKPRSVRELRDSEARALADRNARAETRHPAVPDLTPTQRGEWKESMLNQWKKLANRGLLQPASEFPRAK